MAKISTYKRDTIINDLDKVIGTDQITGRTLNYTMKSIYDYVSDRDVEFYYVYVGDISQDDVDPGISGVKMLGIALEQGTYTNLAGEPSLTEAFGLFDYDGAVWTNITDGLIGDKNVQGDWNESDISSDAYIKNKDKVKSFVGADLVDRQITVDNDPGSEAPIVRLYVDGKRVSETNFEVEVTGSGILLTINYVPLQAGTIFKYRIL